MDHHLHCDESQARNHSEVVQRLSPEHARSSDAERGMLPSPLRFSFNADRVPPSQYFYLIPNLAKFQTFYPTAYAVVRFLFCLRTVATYAKSCRLSLSSRAIDLHDSLLHAL